MAQFFKTLPNLSQISCHYDKQDLFRVTKASHIHGPIVPLVIYQGMYKGLFVYTSPFTKGTPYINLADLVTRGARANTTISNTIISNLTSTLDKIHHKLRDLAALPVTLTHQDLALFNYLIDNSTGQVQAIIDWDGAIYLPVGSNFYFLDSLFGFMTPSSWQDMEDCQELKGVFYNRALASLASQGVGGITKEQPELQKAIGILLYSVKRLLKFKDEQAEHYLDRYLQGLSFMSRLIFLY
ncbi:hypothetical protein BJX99DRAFT_248494 [Aspergillus californicus]